MKCGRAKDRWGTMRPQVGWRPGRSADPADALPAIQNLMLAAPDLGVGTVFTTMHRYHDAEVAEIEADVRRDYVGPVALSNDLDAFEF